MFTLPRLLFCLIVFSFPFLVGFIYRTGSLGSTYLFGQLTLWAAFQVLAVPMVLLRVDYTTLFWSYLPVAVLLAVVGVIRIQKIKLDKPTVFLIIAVLVICWQAHFYVFKMHLDEDDARWIAEANDALVKNKMLLYNPATGEYIGRFVGEMVKDVFSPWPFYVAGIAKITGIRAASIAHTVYPPFLLALSYLAYWEMGKQLFEKPAEQGIFLLMVSVINMFMGGVDNGYTQSVFTLTRIWQGKAVVAAIIIPAIFMLILRIQNDDTVPNWLLLTVTTCAACLFSGMGIAISLLMTAVYGAYVVVCGRWKRIPYWLLSMLPPIVCGLGYFWLKG